MNSRRGEEELRKPFSIETLSFKDFSRFSGLTLLIFFSVEIKESATQTQNNVVKFEQTSKIDLIKDLV